MCLPHATCPQRIFTARAGRLRSGSGLLLRKIPLELVAAADMLSVDEHLRRGRDAVLFHESVDVHAGLEKAVFDLIAVPLQHLQRPYAEGANVVGKNHSVQSRLARSHSVLFEDAVRFGMPARDESCFTAGASPLWRG